MKSWRHKIRELIFGADTAAGRCFDTLLIISILVSVAIVMLDGVVAINRIYGRWFYLWAWGFTLLFTCEYLLRLISVVRPGRYAGGFFGVVDLLAVLPSDRSALVPRETVFHRHPHPASAVGLPGIKTGPVFKPGPAAHGGPAGQFAPNHGVSLRGPDARGHFRCRDECGGRGRKQIHPHPAQHPLDHRRHDHGGIRGHHAPDDPFWWRTSRSSSNRGR